MRALLDTHVLLWFSDGDHRLSTRVRQLLQSETSELFVSAISVAEIAAKFASNKLRLPSPPKLFIQQLIADFRLVPMPLTIEHALRVADLPLFHRDPFDRLLIAQGQVENLPLVSNDPAFSQYAVTLFW